MTTEKNNYNQQFSISARTCTLKYNHQEGNATILGNNNKYIIPIYQRPYSWAEEQVRAFISDIFTSYWGNDGNSIEEPMFIGTMQLSAKDENNSHEIIDGQQRLSTLLVLIKVLKSEFPNCEELNNVSLDWLSTKVNNQSQQQFLNDFISKEVTYSLETLNPYLRNARFIKEILEEQITDEDSNSASFDVNKFVRHLLTNIYFVVIETRAGLSKTLQIFNAINTTGLDLNGGDIFKIRMYEYLRDKKGRGDKAFDEINELYKTIDELNIKCERPVTDMRGILGIYQYILIAKFNLPVILYSYGTDTFFEQLFDTIFNINQWDHFKNNVGDVDLSVDDIKKLIEVRYDWEKHGERTFEDVCALHFIGWSRYRKHWILGIIFLYKFNGEKDYWSKMLTFVRQLSKLYIIYSIRYAKSVNEVSNFTYSLIKKILEGSSDEVISFLNNKIGKLEDHKGRGDLEIALNGDITYNSKLKNIICRLSAMLEENYNQNYNKEEGNLIERLFLSPIDIEHIQSYHDNNVQERHIIFEKWKDRINSIGNLMILEFHKNRSIGNAPYEDKKKEYNTSKYSIVKNQVNRYPNWDLQNCEERQAKEIQKLLQYLFN